MPQSSSGVGATTPEEERRGCVVLTQSWNKRLRDYHKCILKNGKLEIMLEDAKILCNERMKGDYWKIDFNAPQICPEVKPGQFVHVQIAQLRDRILRRPFSICNITADGVLSIVYKVVGEGTEVLSTLNVGVECNLMGPQGVPFSLPEEDEIPVIVAGGYGSAATYILAQRSPTPGILLLGARSEEDIILTNEFNKCGFDVRLATEDGSLGTKGLVTLLLDQVIDEEAEKKQRFRFYGCGPHGMLMAMGQLLIEKGKDGELSLDHLMCCGVGACFACVVKVKADNEDGWRYARTCNEGPVFKASEVYYS
jgi:dihydroorotate dehydrogenase electron transfer subunit